MQPLRPLSVVLTIVSYIVATFAVQATSHFVVFADHYAATSILRETPIVALGFLSMVVQGLVFAGLFPLVNRDGRTMRNALRLAWTLGAFLVSYIALAEAGKYAIPSIPAWLAVEVTAAAAQFTLFGVLLGTVQRHFGASAAVPANA